MAIHLTVLLAVSWAAHNHNAMNPGCNDNSNGFACKQWGSWAWATPRSRRCATGGIGIPAWTVVNTSPVGPPSSSRGAAIPSQAEPHDASTITAAT